MLFDADLLQQQELVTLPSVQSISGEKSAEHSGKAIPAKDSTKTSANALFKKAAAGKYFSFCNFLFKLFIGNLFMSVFF